MFLTQKMVENREVLHDKIEYHVNIFWYQVYQAWPEIAEWLG